MSGKKALRIGAVLVTLALVATACPKAKKPTVKEAIPFGNNKNGANFNGWNNAEATKLIKASDKELDETKRVADFKRIGQLSREDVASIPLYAKQIILTWNSARLGQNLDFNAGQTGFSYELNKWALSGGDTTTLKFGAEQWPTCLNPVTACANSSWMWWLTLPMYPQLVALDNNNDFIPSPLIKKIPNEADGTLTKDPFTLTYELNPLTWADGTPITGEDIKFTWQTVMQTPDAISRIGYELITDVVTAGNKVTIKFKEPYAPWKTLFGGGAAGICEKAAFPKGPNITKEFATNVPFSGGAYKFESYSDEEMVLSANAAYKGPNPAKIKKIVFRNLQKGGQAAEVAALRTGEIDAAFPQAADALIEIADGKVPNGKIKIKGGTQFEGLWFNLDHFPVNNKAVREAVLQVLDRQAPVSKIFGWTEKAGFKTELNRCLFYVKFVLGGRYCNDDFPVAPDLAKAISTLVADGWKLFNEDVSPEKEIKDPGTNLATEMENGTTLLWKKNGTPLTLRFGTTAGNTAREQTQLALLKQLVAFGIDAHTDNSPAGFLFQVRHPSRQWTMLEYASVATPDPTITSNWAGDQIPACKTCPDG